MRQYLDFCFSHNLATTSDPLPPPTEENLVYFIASLQGKVQYQTVKLYLAAISNFYIEHNQPIRSSHMFQLHRMLKGIKRTSSSRHRIRRPITIQILSEIFTLLRPDYSEEIDTVMLWAAFTLAFFGFLRVSEFTYSGPGKPFLSINDIAFTPNINKPEAVQVHIKQSKTDPFREGTTLNIAKSHSPVCAVTALREYLLQRNSTHAEAPLFVLQNGEPISWTVLNSNLRELLHSLGYAAKEYARIALE